MKKVTLDDLRKAAVAKLGSKRRYSGGESVPVWPEGFETESRHTVAPINNAELKRTSQYFYYVKTKYWVTYARMNQIKKKAMVAGLEPDNVVMDHKRYAEFA